MKRVFLLPAFGLSLAGCFADASDPGLNADAASAPPRLRQNVAPTGPGGNSAQQERARTIALRFLETQLADRGIHPLADLSIMKNEIDELSMAHVRVQQRVSGVPVFGGQAIVHLREDGSLFGFTDDLVRDVRVDPVPDIERDDAIGLALDAYDCPDCLTETPTAELVILPRDGRHRLTWRVRLERLDGTRETSIPVLFIDAHTGDEVWRYDDLRTVAGQGSSYYSGTVSFDSTYAGGTYYLEDTSRDLGAFDARGTTDTVYRYSDSDNNFTHSSARAGVDVHYGMARMYDYLQSQHGRNGINGANGPGYYTAADGSGTLVTSIVRYGSSYNNAFWNGSLLYFGDGDGASYGPLVAMDVVAHEMMHGVTDYTAGLIYSGESGALDESIADVFAAMLEWHLNGDTTDAWTIGEDCYTPSTSGDAIRSLNDPHSGTNYGYTSDDNPDHYTERYTGTGDSGGVHINSGIPSKVFYLVAKGGSHHKGGSMTGIGVQAAGKIWYKALTSYMTSSTDFMGARRATLYAAAALYGSWSTEYTAVSNAWNLAGLGVVTWYGTSSYTGTSFSWEYEYASNGTCFGLSNTPLNDAASSLKFAALPGYRTSIAWYTGSSCNGSVGGVAAGAGTDGAISNLSTVGFDNSISSYRVLWNSDQSTVSNRCFGLNSTLLKNELATLIFQGDGNLVLYKTFPGGNKTWAAWATGTNGSNASQVCFQGDGNLVVYSSSGSALWASGTNGQGVTSMKLQSDCNLVMYNGTGSAKWSTGTSECWNGG